MTNNDRHGVLRVTDWAVLGALHHEARRRIFKLCWEKARSVGELAGLLEINPGTALYHVRRLAAAGLLLLEDTEKKRGVIEKRYRSAGQVIDFQPPVKDLERDAFDPVMSLVLQTLRSVDLPTALKEHAPLLGHIAEARIGKQQQEIIGRRLGELAKYAATLPDEPDGVPMVFAAIFGPRKPDVRAQSAPRPRSTRQRKRRK